MKCEIERMEINYMFYLFTFFEKVIKKLLTFCYWWDDEVFLLRYSIIEDKMIPCQKRRMK